MKTSGSKLKVAVSQINTHLGNLKFNSKKIQSDIRKALKQNADLIIFPELSICGYPPEDLLLKNYFNAGCRKELMAIASKHPNIRIILGFPEKTKDGRLFNSAALLFKGKMLKVYRKNLLPNYGVFDERRYFSRGEESLLFEINGFKVALTICEDIWIKNSVVMKRLISVQPDLLINLSASPYSITKQNHRNKILTDACKSVRTHILYCNLIGGQDELVFDGRSRLMSPEGETLAAFNAFREDFKVLLLHKKPGKKTHKIEYKKSTSRKEISEKKDELRDILSALELGLRDYVQKNNFSKVLIGLSGGVDSALVAALAVRALGKKSVIGVTMPSVYSSKSTYRDAFKTAEVCGIQIWSIPIKDIHDQMLTALHPFFKKTVSGVAEENLQARIRGSILMSLSNKFNWLVLATGNKSEMATGYCTLYGDMCGGFAPIKDLSKTLVYKLCRYINKIETKEIIPLSVIRRAPTAELRPNQKDRDSLPPYSELDKILEQYVELDMPSTSFKTKIKQRDVNKIIGMVNRNEYKRRQAAIGTKITSKAFGKDRRLPITNGFHL